MSVFWGLNAVGSKVLYRPDGAHFDAIGLFVARSAWTLPIFLVMMVTARPRGGIAREDWWKIAVLGVCFGPGTTGVFALGAQHTSGAHVVMLFSLAPAVTAVISVFALGERMTLARGAAFAFGIAGAALLTFGHASGGSHPYGDALILVMVLSFSILTVIVRSIGREKRYAPLFLTGTYGTLGTLILVVFGIAIGRGSAIMQPLTPHLDTLLWFFGLMVLGLSIIAQVAQVFVLRRLGATAFSVVSSYASLLVGIAGAVLILHETLTPIVLIAGSSLAIALGLAVLPDRPNRERAR